MRDQRGQRLVTSIEILSPGNKRSQRSEYLKKRNRLLKSDANLVELDLLIGGKRLPMREPLPPGHYFAFVGRSKTRPLTDIGPLTLHDSLPTIPIPLRGDDPDVILDLQQIFTAVYDHTHYDEILDYSVPPEVKLAPEDAEWVRKQTQRPQKPSRRATT
ncbi:MAG: DUF4058 family protein [Planctomycetaceae bacterium]